MVTVFSFFFSKGIFIFYEPVFRHKYSPHIHPTIQSTRHDKQKCLVLCSRLESLGNAARSEELQLLKQIALTLGLTGKNRRSNIRLKKTKNIFTREDDVRTWISHTTPYTYCMLWSLCCTELYVVYCRTANTHTRNIFSRRGSLAIPTNRKVVLL